MSENRVASLAPSVATTGGDSIRVAALAPYAITTNGGSILVVAVAVYVIYQIPYDAGNESVQLQCWF